MLESISWKEFFSGVTMLIGLYYTLAGLVLYREELKLLFTEGLVKRTRVENDSIDVDTVSLIGAIAKPAREEDPDDELRFAPGKYKSEDEGEGFTASVDATLVGTVADLGEDTRILCRDIGQATRGQVSDSFCTLLKKYARLNSTSYRATINMLISETIREKSAHAIDAKEVDTWW